MRPILFYLPVLGWPVSSYQTLLAVGFVAGIFLAVRLAPRYRADPVHVLDMSLYAVLGGIFGARALYYYEFYDRYFRQRPWYELFYVHQGGFVFYGGFACAFAACLVYLLWAKRRARLAGAPPVRVLGTLDVLAAPLALGLSFGRVGCLLNGCCWGLRDQGHALLALRFPAGSYPWNSHHIRHGWIPSDAAQSLPVHATQVYSWGAAVLLCLVLLVVLRMQRRVGQTSGAFFLLYGPIRFVLEAFREHAPGMELVRFGSFSDQIARLSPAAPWLFRSDGSLTNSQLISVGLLALGVVWFGLASLCGERARLPCGVSAAAPSVPADADPGAA